MFERTPGVRISNITPIITSQRLAVTRPARSNTWLRKLQYRLRRQSVRRRVLRSALVISNALLLVLILFFVLKNPATASDVKPVTVSNAVGSTQLINPVDQLSSANIALTVARMNSLPETTAITNQAQSQAADMAIISNGGSVLSKPQVVATALKSRIDIQNYVAKSGDTISGLAAQFGVTSDSIRWSNNLTGNNLAAGTKLVIPPVNGIVYTVKAGDTPDTLATKFKANKDQIIAYNDAEISGIKVGEQILIPNGTVTVVNPVSYGSYSTWGGVFSGNGYDYGYCTWWVASRRIQVGKTLPSTLGNASRWPYWAGQYGISEGNTPRTYAAAVTSTRGEGHVVFVEAVNSDGSIVITEMNHLGWGVEDSRTISANEASSFIYIY